MQSGNYSCFWWNCSHYSHKIEFGVESLKISEAQFVKFQRESIRIIHTRNSVKRISDVEQIREGIAVTSQLVLGGTIGEGIPYVFEKI